MKRVFALAFVCALGACGVPQDDPYAEQPGGGQPQQPTPQQPTPQQPGQPAPQGFAAIKPVVDRACGTCHSNGQSPKLETEQAFKTAKVRQLIENGRMPPGGRINAADKTALLAYLKG